MLQGEFKAVYIETNEQLLHLSRYIHLNPLVGYVVKDLNDYPWSSYSEYIENATVSICSKEVILKQFSSHQKYQQFVADQREYAEQLEYIKHQLLEDPHV